MEELHTFLVNFNPFSVNLTIDQLAMHSVKLIRDLPPDRMARRVRGCFLHSCTVDAKLVNDTWWVPEMPPQRLQLPRVIHALGFLPVSRLLVGPAALAGVAAVGLLMWQGGSGMGF
jgi:hypothetical protein